MNQSGCRTFASGLVGTLGRLSLASEPTSLSSPLAPDAVGCITVTQRESSNPCFRALGSRCHVAWLSTRSVHATHSDDRFRKQSQKFRQAETRSRRTVASQRDNLYSVIRRGRKAKCGANLANAVWGMFDAIWTEKETPTELKSPNRLLSTKMVAGFRI